MTPVLEKLDRIISAGERQASELAIPRLKRECQGIEGEIAERWDYIDDWTEHHGKRRSGAVTSGVIFGLVGAVLSGCGGILHWSVIPFGLLATGGLCAAVVFLRWPNQHRVRDKVHNARERIEELEDALARRRWELRKHYDNVRL